MISINIISTQYSSFKFYKAIDASKVPQRALVQDLN